MKLLIPLFLILFSMIGCATPSPVFIVAPAETAHIWSNGTNYIQKESNGVVYSIGYAEHYYNQIRFNVDIENNSLDSIEINPVKFDCYGYKASIPDSALKSQPVYYCLALNPETLIVNIRIERERAIAEQKNKSYQRILTSGIHAFFYGLFSPTPKNEFEKERQDVEQKESKRQLDEQEDRDYENCMIELDRLQDFYSYEVLRKTILAPKKYISGKVVIPVPAKTMLLLVRYRSSKPEVQMWFEHKTAVQSQND